MSRRPSPQWLLVLAFAVSGCLTEGPDLPAPAPLSVSQYPASVASSQVDDYHGTKVPDPYRWLEDPDSDETKAWVHAQNKVTMAFLRSLDGWDEIRERLTKLWNYEKYSAPFREGGKTFYSKNDGLQSHSVFYVMDADGAEPRVLLNPNKFSEDGTVSLAGLAISPDGNLAAYGTSSGGSDWREWQVIDVNTGEKRSDHLQWIKFSSVGWSPDNTGFYYSRYPEPQKGDELEQANYHHTVYYHKLGDSQDLDRKVYSRPDQKKWLFSPGVTDDGQYLVLDVSEGTDRRTRFYYQDLSDPNGEIVHLLDDFDAEYMFLGNVGPWFFFKTDLEADMGRVISINTLDPHRDLWLEVIPEQDVALQGASLINKQIVASYLVNASSEIRIHNQDGALDRTLELPGIGSASGFGGKIGDTDTFYTFSSFLSPPTVYHYDFPTGRSTALRKPEVDFDSSGYETRQEWATSKDGTRIPYFITHKKGLQKSGDNPTLLYAYGGFNISLTPRFSVSNLIWLESGGIYVQATLRGGAEFGEKWHEAGMLAKKQNVFDDFIAVGEHLIAEGYTSSDHLGIRGGSNGGLLVGACMAQRPDLFGAALPAVGVMDMLRYHKWTIGWAWVPEYGSADNPEQFPFLHAYSPVHNLKKGVSYPPTLITTADHDDRVVPAHSFKFAAALQEAHRGDDPVLIRIETRAGHGAGKPTWMQIEEATDTWAFLTWALRGRTEM